MSDINEKNEEIVGRVLQGLRDATPSEGIESRILSKLQHRASTTPAPTRSPWKIASLAGGAVLAGMICAVFFTAQRKTPQAALPLSPAISMQAGNGNGVPAKIATLKLFKPTARRARFATASASQKEELAWTSYPAPPMPLTDQEKLLLRLVHKDDPVQLAMLDPAQRAARYAEERTQVQQFFATPTQEITSEP